MDEDRKLALIIGCSLGGAALIFILALVLVCVSSRRAASRSASNVSSISDKATLSSDTDQHDKVRGQRLDKVEWAQPPFMRTGSQLWRTNVALTTAPPLSLSTIDRQQVQRHESTVSHERQKKLENRNQQRKKSNVPWYEKTLAKADQFLIHRPVTYHSNCESGEKLVNVGHSLDRSYQPNSASAAIQGIPVNHISTSSSESSGNAYVIYGSQTALIPDDDVRVHRREHARVTGAVNQAYLSRSTLITEQPKLSVDDTTINRFASGTIDYSSNKPKSVHTLIQRFESKKSPAAMQPKRTDGLYLSPANLTLPDNQMNYKYRSRESSDYLCPQPSMDVISSHSRPPKSVRPVNIQSASSQPARHPTRPDTPVYNPQRGEGWQQQCDNDNGAQQNRPRYVSHINSFSEERKVQDAFKFLDDMD